MNRTVFNQPTSSESGKIIVFQRPLFNQRFNIPRVSSCLFPLAFPLDCLASDPRGTDFGHRLRRHRGNPVHGVHAETAQRITEAPAFHAEGGKGGSSYGKTKADFKSEE